MAATYYASIGESATAANKRHIGVFNGAASGKTLVVYRILAAGTQVPLAAIRLLSQPSGNVTSFAKADPSTADAPAEVVVGTGLSGGSIEPIAFGLGVPNGQSIYEAPIDGSEQLKCPPGTGFEVRQLTTTTAGSVSIVAVVGLEDAA